MTFQSEIYDPFSETSIIINQYSVMLYCKFNYIMKQFKELNVIAMDIIITVNKHGCYDDSLHSYDNIIL